MNNSIQNLKSIFTMPKVSPTRPTSMQQSQPGKFIPSYEKLGKTKPVVQKPSQPQSPKKLEKKEFSLDFFQGAITDPVIYKDDFRQKARKKLEGTLKNFSTRDTVADLLWDRRGNGLKPYEIKDGLKKLVKDGKLTSGQVQAVRKKMRL